MTFLGTKMVVQRPWCVPILAMLVVILLVAVPTQQAAIAEGGTPTPGGANPREDRQADDVPPMRRQARDNDIKFERISLEQGLSGSTVSCILQDSKGFMWFGTHDGLNRYDGYEFDVYRHDPENPDSLGGNAVWTIYEDRSGVLWVGTDGGGLDRFDQGNRRFVHYRHDPNDPDSLSHNDARIIHEDRSGVLWIGTGGGGLD